MMKFYDNLYSSMCSCSRIHKKEMIACVVYSKNKNSKKSSINTPINSSKVCEQKFKKSSEIVDDSKSDRNKFKIGESPEVELNRYLMCFKEF